MSFSLNLHPRPLPSFPRSYPNPNLNHTRSSIFGVSFSARFRLRDTSTRRFSSSNYNASADAHKSSNDDGPREENESHHRRPLKSNEILNRLKRYGLSGVLSYGLLNTAYYVTTFLVVWLYVAPAPGRLGYLAAAERFIKVMATVWAGSQVTKLVRAGGALALAPFVDKGLSWFTVKFRFQSQGKAFMAIVGFCFLLAFVLFIVVTLLWA